MRVRLSGLAAVVVGVIVTGTLTPAGAAEQPSASARPSPSASSSASALTEAEELRHALEETSRELVEAAAALAAAQAKLPPAQAAVAAAQAELAVARAKDDRLGQELDVAQAQESRARRQLRAIAADIATSRDVLGRIARAAYESGRLDELSVVLEARTPEDLANRAALVQSSLRSQNSVLGDLAEDRADVVTTTATLEAKRIQIAKLKKEAEANLGRVARLEAEAVAAQRAVEALIAAAAEAKAALERELAAEEARAAVLALENEALAAMLRRIAEERASRGEGGRYIPSSGLLQMPVDGRLTSPYGYRIHPISGVRKMHDGMDIAAPCGTPIRAAESGTVLRAASAGGYGNFTVIDHGLINGGSISTAYAHQSRFAKGVGDTVARGEVLGYVGTTGYSTGCHLHFIVYVNGATTNPAAFL